jgi:hypothetical protein
MAKVKATVVMYQHKYRVQDSLTEEEYKAKLNERIDEYDNSDYDFNDWLADNYSRVDIFHMGQDEKELVFQEYHEINIKYAEEGLAEEWERIETTVYVDLDKQLKNECNCGCPCCGRK